MVRAIFTILAVLGATVSYARAHDSRGPSEQGERFAREAPRQLLCGLRAGEWSRLPGPQGRVKTFVSAVDSSVASSRARR